MRVDCAHAGSLLQDSHKQAECGSICRCSAVHRGKEGKTVKATIDLSTLKNLNDDVIRSLEMIVATAVHGGMTHKLESTRAAAVVRLHR